MEQDYDFDTLVADHHVGVWRYLRLLGCDDATAEDLTQEAFLGVLRAPFDYRGKAAAGAYMRRAARNLFLNTKRRPGSITLPDEMLRAADAADRTWEVHAANGEGEELMAALRGCIGALPAPARQALDMRYGRDASREEIARALDLTDAGARSLLQRTKAELRACIERRLKRGTA